MSLLPPTAERQALWDETIRIIEDHIEHLPELRVSPAALDPAALRRDLAACTFEQPMPGPEGLRWIAQRMSEHAVHTPHPCYFGLFNPAPSALGIAAETMTAAFNPQLAAWSHSPFAVEVEHHVIKAIAERLGYPREDADGVFATGGAEANHTALLCALAARWPESIAHGLRVCAGQPVLYVSQEGHHSFAKAARASGLGEEAVRLIPCDSNWRMDVAAAEARIRADREAGCAPFLLVGTAGTTGSGVIDPLPALAALGQREGLWFHVDAAWAGAAALVSEMKPALAGIEHADSITLDAHKWLSVPMTAGMFFTRHPEILGRTFGFQVSYMPKEAAQLEITDPFSHSIQWSRRFAGLKVFATLLAVGWEGYAGTLRHHISMGDLLRRCVAEQGWTIHNQTPLPLVCFTPAGVADTMEAHQRVTNAVVASGKAWISTVRLGGRRASLRACITNYRTQPEHVERLIEAVREAVSR